MATTQATNKKLVAQFVEDVFNEGNLDSMDQYLAEGYVEHTSGPNPDVEGIPAAREYHGTLNEAFPDFEVTIEDLIAEGNKVVQRSRISGTHEGEFMDIPPTGNEIDVPGALICRIEDGKVAESWGLNDTLGLMAQLGIVDLPGE
jgi:predicted ester cyclase